MHCRIKKIAEARFTLVSKRSENTTDIFKQQILRTLSMLSKRKQIIISHILR